MWSQAAIDCPLAHTVVVRSMGGSPWIVAPRTPASPNATAGLHNTLRAAVNFSSSNQLIIFEPGCVVEAKRWHFHGMHDSLFFIGGIWVDGGGPVRNVTVQGHGATWKMWKRDYQCTACPAKTPGPCEPCPRCDPNSRLYNQTQCYTKAEWRHGLNIMCGVDITIKGLVIDSTGGDGIMTGGLQAGTASTRTRNVVIQGVELSNNHRQGISVVSAVGLLVEDSTMRGTNGTAPEAGVDIEPDDTGSILVDIVFRRCHFLDNNGCGVVMALKKLEHDVDAPMSILFEDCHVGWRDDYMFESHSWSTDPFGAGIMVGGAKAAGSITVRGGTVTGSAGAGISVVNKPLSGPTITFADVTLNNTGRVDKGFPQPWMLHVAPIMLIDEIGGIGGLWFESVRVIMLEP